MRALSIFGIPSDLKTLVNYDLQTVKLILKFLGCFLELAKTYTFLIA